MFLTCFNVLLVLLVQGNDFHAPLVGVGWIQDLIESGVALLVVHELNKLGHWDRLGFGAAIIEVWFQ